MPWMLPIVRRFLRVKTICWQMFNSDMSFMHTSSSIMIVKESIQRQNIIIDEAS